MQTRLNISLTIGAIRQSLALCVIAVPIITLFAANPLQAQPRDRYDDRDPHYYCDGLARDRTARFSERDTVGNAVGDAIGGAILGGIIGGIAGDAGKGAGIGAGVGVIGGGKERADDRKAFYRREYDACMRRNGR